MVVVVFGVVATQCLGGGGGGGGSGGSGGFDISDVLNQFPGATPQAAPDQDITEDGPDPEADQVDFVSFVLDDVQQTSATTGSSPRPVRA